MAKPIKRQSMRGFSPPLLAIALLACSAPPASAATKPPVVVELFTSQGCTGCRQADTLLSEYAEAKGVVALAFSVDYWDYLGWRDTFAQPGFSDRQRAYADRLHIRGVYTPEIIVNGRSEAAGLDREKIDRLIKAAAQGREHGAPRLTFAHHGAKIQVGPGEPPSQGADVWLVRYDPKVEEVKVTAGENKGKTISLRNVVHSLLRLGSWSGKRRTFVTPKSETPGLITLVLVQGAKGGPILVAAKD